MKKTAQEPKVTDNPLYHDTWMLLRKYRDVVWSLELSVQQVRRQFQIEYGSSIEEFLESLYVAGITFEGSAIEDHARCIERSYKMLKLLDINLYRSRFRSDLFCCRLRCRGRLAPHNRRDRFCVRRIRLGHRCELDAEAGVGQRHVQSIMLRSLNIQAGRRVFLCHGGDVAAGGVGIILVEEYLCLDDRQLIRDAQRRQPRASGRIFQPEPELFISQVKLVSVGSLFQEAQRIEACDTVQLRHDGDSIEQSGFGCIHFKSSFLNKNMRQGVDLTRLPHFYKIFTVILKHCAAAL